MILFTRDMAGRYAVKDAVSKYLRDASLAQQAIIDSLDDLPDDDQYEAAYTQACADIKQARADAYAELVRSCAHIPDSTPWIQHYTAALLQ